MLGVVPCHMAVVSRAQHANQCHSCDVQPFIDIYLLTNNGSKEAS